LGVTLDLDFPCDELVIGLAAAFIMTGWLHAPAIWFTGSVGVSGRNFLFFSFICILTNLIIDIIKRNSILLKKKKYYTSAVTITILDG